MVDYTQRLKLPQLEEAGNEGQNEFPVHQRAGQKIIDDNIGFFRCTSTTRPSAPYEGMQILETNTKRTLYWNGTRWVIMNTPITAGVLTSDGHGLSGSASWTRSGDVVTAQFYINAANGGGPILAWTHYQAASNFPKPRYINIAGGYDTGVPILTNQSEFPTMSVVIGSGGSLNWMARWSNRSWTGNAWFRSSFTYYTADDDTA